jgi:hypothetical protein
MDAKPGDVYIRKSDGKIYRVKKIDNKMIVLESEDSSQLALTDIFGLEKAYTKQEERAPFHHPLSPNLKE